MAVALELGGWEKGGKSQEENEGPLSTRTNGHKFA
jgi:hypothetical protein